MKQNLSIFLLRLRAATDGLIFVVSKPLYVFIAVFGVLLASSIILWSLNLELVGYILFEAPIGFADKINFFAGTYRDIFITYNSLHALGITVFSLLFGINIMLLLFVIINKRFSSVPKKSGFGGTILAVIAGGCVACGTSLLSPLLATFGASSTIFLRDLSLWLNWIASLLMLYSIYRLASATVSIKAGRNDTVSSVPV